MLWGFVVVGLFLIFFPSKMISQQEIKTPEEEIQEMLLKTDEVFEFSSITQISITSTLFTGVFRRSTESIQISMSQKIIGISKCSICL